MCDDDCCSCVPYRARDNIKYCCICFAIVAVIVIFAVLLAAYAFLLRVSITVEDASLTKFTVLTAPATAIAYNLSLVLMVKNPNWAMSIKNTEPFMAAYKFDGQQFDRVKVSDKGEKHGARKTKVYRLTTGTDADGEFVSLGNAGVAEYEDEKKKGVFEVEVVLTGVFRYTARYTKCKIEATCPLKLQLVQPGAATVVFEKVKCKLAKPEKNC
ncbi:NDR1/HIN1-like protein 10 [Brachypodium distachyon]|uniref:Uncharacterized protein n=1 Tax=Brachypodium distachyon TaxID=15368 RepID=A0A0Q3JR82_BRADI|nr:NDR1/HIN1-like protein 10 [Brachypodium distachyon]KQK20235.1 hypothetical protein BRADI_1g53270v3 [Brachypodium distachyon]|eukprot:XP_003561274.1 NDR1/HIN1-like protein 10 [Brachypodium distachyon]